MTSSSIVSNDKRIDREEVLTVPDLIKLTIQEEGDNNDIKHSIIKDSRHNKVLYYFLKDLLLLKESMAEDITLFYDKDKNSLWKLKMKDWHGLTLKHNDIQVILSTTSPNFKFTFHQVGYDWKIVLLDDNQWYLNCYENNILIAELKNNQLSLLNTNDTIFSSLLCLTGLLVHYHIKYLLKSLGNQPEMVIQMISNQQDDEIASLSSAKTKNSGHDFLINHDSRSSIQSFKSIELNPGFWHCYWGYKFWWSWFPCCMPGGFIDKIWIKIKGTNNSKHGYQQQRY